MTQEIAARYQQVLENITSVAHNAGRNAKDIQLVVVTKGHSPKSIETLYQLGVRQIGENRVEEALTKQEIVGNLPGLEWHMIGHLQSRKAKLVCGRFGLLHSVDRLKLAQRLDQTLQETNTILPILLQFNVSGETTKSGWEATSESDWPKLLPEVESVLQFSHLEVRGLMTMAPYSTNPEDARPHFARLRNLRDFLATQFPSHPLDELSMGMSGDYQVGIQEGATILRIGTAIMGSLY